MASLCAVALTAEAPAKPATDLPAPGERPASFVACAACHKTAPNERSAMGPNLYRIANRRAGTGQFNYSAAMKASRATWNRKALIAFIENPRKVIPGNRMPYPGNRDPKAAAEIADYVLSLK
ncbi:c-type cytochrome [Sphingomonas sp.]|uniref:c-type cytochrome n=1 Tax=Sphingomonas sp. TaxID=28214 RepID=UPI002ED7D678